MRIALVSLSLCVIACGGPGPAPEMAPHPRDSTTSSREPSGTAEDRLVELIDGLARSLSGAERDCARARQAFDAFASDHADEARALTEQISERGAQAQLLSRLASQIESLQRVVLSCPDVAAIGLFEGEDHASFGDAFVAKARTGAVVYWRLGESCHAIKLAGDVTGQLLRLSPAPVLRFSYAVETNDLVISAGDADPGPLQELGIDAACRDRLPLLAPDSGTRLGDGRWHDSEADCLAATADPAPTSCSSTVSALLAESPVDGDRFATVYDRNGSISVVTVSDGRPLCAEWKFTGRGRSKMLRRTVDNSVVYFDARYDGKTLRLTDHAHSVTPISESVVQVGQHPWFIGADCAGLEMATL